MPPFASFSGAGERFTWQHVRVGAVRYRNANTVVLAPQGLYLSVRLPNHPPLLIPWSELRTVGPATIYWQPFMQFAVGETGIKIALPQTLYQRAQNLTIR